MKNRDNKVYSTGLLLFALIFYLFFASLDGAVICADSPSYIEMSISREFLYPSLLAIFRMVFGKQYLLMIVVLQSLLAAFAAWNITVYIKRQFSLGYFLSTVVFLISIFVSLLNRFIAGRGSMYSNSILTEGITIPLFLLFFRYLYDYFVNHTKNSFVVASVITGILVATRKQMYVALILLFLVTVLVKAASVKDSSKSEMKKWILSIGRAFILCIGILLSVTLLDHTYNYIVRGRFVGHSSDNRFILTMVFYASEKEYVEELPEELRPLFLDIYEKCDEEGYLMHSAGEGWYNNVVHFGDYYDLIQINTMWPAIQHYVENHYTSDSTERELITDDITNIMITSLMPKTAPKIARALFNNVLSGLVTTIAQRNHILIWYSLLAYAGYLFLLLYYRKLAGCTDAVVKLCLLTLLSIIVNVALVSAVIFCQTRYTIYNMPLFYISGLVLVRNVTEKVRDKKMV